MGVSCLWVCVSSDVWLVWSVAVAFCVDVECVVYGHYAAGNITHRTKTSPRAYSLFIHKDAYGIHTIIRQLFRLLGLLCFSMSDPHFIETFLAPTHTIELYTSSNALYCIY